MSGKVQSPVSSWRERVHTRSFIERLEKYEPSLHFTTELMLRIEDAILVTQHWKSPDVDAANKRLELIREAVGAVVPLLQDHLETDKANGMSPKYCVPGCDDAVTLLRDLEKIAATGDRVPKRRGRGRPSDKVTDWMLKAIWEIYRQAGGRGTLGSNDFRYVLDELAKVMPRDLLIRRAEATDGKWLVRRAKDARARVHLPRQRRDNR